MKSLEIRGTSSAYTITTGYHMVVLFWLIWITPNLRSWDRLKVSQHDSSINWLIHIHRSSTKIKWEEKNLQEHLHQLRKWRKQDTCLFFTLSALFSWYLSKLIVKSTKYKYFWSKSDTLFKICSPYLHFHYKCTSRSWYIFPQ